jgi:hypothetical protein
MREKKTAIDEGWRIPDELWVHIEPLLPAKAPHTKGGRPGQQTARPWMASFTCYALAVNGKLSLGSLVPPAPSMTAANSGGKLESSSGCGRRDSLSMLP